MRLTLTIGMQEKADGGADAARADTPCDLRCVCGSLVAKVIDDFVELKCRRCKRTLRIPVRRGP